MTKQKKSRSGGLHTFFISILLVIALTFAICGLVFAWYVHACVKPNADLNIDELGMNFTSFIYVKDPDTGKYYEYQKLHGQENRVWVDMKYIPKQLGEAFISIEDQRFYSHHGVDWKRTTGAVFNYLLGKGNYGGSTITQQLIKNLTEDNEYSVKRKITEIFRALALERQIKNKDRILEMYMNTIPFGQHAYGVKAAARTYFNKDVSNLTLAECAVIAGITNAPTRYNPFTHPENIKERQTLILNAMYDQGFITKQQRDEAVAEKLHYQRPVDENGKTEPYSYFTDTVYNDVVGDLQTKLHYSYIRAVETVTSGGLKIYATMNPKVQSAMEQVFTDESNFPSTSRNGVKPQSAMVVLNPDGGIAGVVGGRGKKTASLIQNRATQTTRQPGSSIKPISVYGPAIDAGLITPYTEVEDSPYTKIDGASWPKNDNGEYTGSMLIRDAVANSVNTIAVKTLAKLTPQKSYDFLTQKLGFTHLVGSRTTSSGKVLSDIGLAPLALGGLTDGVTVREMAGAYTVFVNQGKYYAPHSYTKVVDSSGKTLLSNENLQPVVAFQNEKTAYYMNDVLQDVVSSGTGKGAKVSGMDTAGKTGTTTSNRDRWFCGYTPYYVGACWFGYDANYKLTGLGYVNPSVTLWKAVMAKIHEGLPDKSFATPGQGFTKMSYCTITGLLPRSSCLTAEGYFYEGDEPTETCSGHSGRSSSSSGSKHHRRRSSSEDTSSGSSSDEEDSSTADNGGSSQNNDTSSSGGGSNTAGGESTQGSSGGSTQAENNGTTKSSSNASTSKSSSKSSSSKSAASTTDPEH